MAFKFLKNSLEILMQGAASSFGWFRSFVLRIVPSPNASKFYKATFYGLLATVFLMVGLLVARSWLPSDAGEPGADPIAQGQGMVLSDYAALTSLMDAENGEVQLRRVLAEQKTPEPVAEWLVRHLMAGRAFLETASLKENSLKSAVPLFAVDGYQPFYGLILDAILQELGWDLTNGKLQSIQEGLDFLNEQQLHLSDVQKIKRDRLQVRWSYLTTAAVDSSAYARLKTVADRAEFSSQDEVETVLTVLEYEYRKNLIQNVKNQLTRIVADIKNKSHNSAWYKNPYVHGRLLEVATALGLHDPLLIPVSGYHHAQKLSHESCLHQVPLWASMAEHRLFSGNLPAAKSAIDQARDCLSSQAVIDSHRAGLLNNAVGLYELAQENPVVALQAFHDAEVAFRSVYGADSVVTASVYNNKGVAARRAGRVDEAREHYTEAQRIWEKELDSGHLLLATHLNNMAELELQLNASDAVLEQFRISLEVRQRHLGLESPLVAVVLSNLGELFVKRNALDEAMKMHQEALQIRKNFWKSDHPDVAASLNNVASILHAKGDLSGAAEYYQSSIDMSRAVLGPQHPKTMQIMANFVAVVVEARDFSKADQILDELISGIDPDASGDWSSLLQLYSKKAEVSLQLGDLESAAQSFAAVLDVSSRHGLPMGRGSLAAVALQALKDIHVRTGDRQKLLELNRKYGKLQRS